MPIYQLTLTFVENAEATVTLMAESEQEARERVVNEMTGQGASNIEIKTLVEMPMPTQEVAPETTEGDNVVAFKSAMN